MSDQPWYLSPAGWLLELGSALPGLDAAARLGAALPGVDVASRLSTRFSVELLFDVVRSQMVGRRIEATLARKPVAFTIDSVDARFDPFGAAIGQVDDVSFAASAPVYDGLHAQRFVASARNVHTRPAINPTLVAAPLEVAVVMDWPQTAAFLRRFLVKFDVQPLGEQHLRVCYNGRRARRGWIDVQLAAEAGRIELRPTAAGWGRLRRQGLTALSAIPVPTAVADGVRVVDVAVDQADVTVVLRIDEMSVPYDKLLAFP